MKDALLSAPELAALEVKLEAGQAFVEASAGECLAPLDDWPRNPWGAAALALLDDGPRLVATAKAAEAARTLEALLRAALPSVRAKEAGCDCAECVGRRRLAAEIARALGERVEAAP